MLEQKIVHCVARDVSEHKRAQELLTRYTDTLNRKNLETQEDLTLAREVHQTFLQKDYPVFPPTGKSAVRFAHRYLPTSALGGDFFEILPVSDVEAGIFICDVMGHGMRAALVTSILRGLLDKYRTSAHDPGGLLRQVNQALQASLKTVSSTIFATACYGVLDVTSGRLRLANAGHPAPLLIRAGNWQVERLTGTRAPALGLMGDATFPVTTAMLATHDRLLMFTDGMYEVDGPDGTQLGLDAFLTIVRQHASQPGTEMLDELLLACRRFAATGEFSDDVCLVSVERAC